MKLRLKLWRYSIYNIGGAEEMLNAMAADGWNLHRIVGGFMYFEKAEPGKRKQYTIDFLGSGLDDSENTDEDALRAYYADVGWDFEMALPTDNMYLFSADCRQKLPRAYVTEEERFQQYKKRRKKGAFIGGVLMVLLWCAMIYLESRMNTESPWNIFYYGIGIFWIIRGGVPVLATLSYNRLRQGNFWTRLVDHGQVILEGFCVLFMCCSLAVNAILLANGSVAVSRRSVTLMVLCGAAFLLYAFSLVLGTMKKTEKSDELTSLVHNIAFFFAILSPISIIWQLDL